MEQQEFFFSCPYCWTQISMMIDPSSESQSYIEDCERCCHPIKVSYSVQEGEILGLEAERAQ